MGKVVTGASMSLDGYVSGPGQSGFDRLFQWYGNGRVTVETADPGLTFQLTDVSAAHWRRLVAETGALVVGRKLFDFTEGWGGRHPMDVPVVLLSHSVPEGWPREDAPFHFVTDGGIERAVAVARDLAGGKNVVVNSGTMATQALEAGLLDEVGIDLVPVILGDGTPFFIAPADAPYTLEGPVSIAEGDRVTHLRYRVRYDD
ncbi:deaminase [Streptomyces solincola]|uniref:Deaminase n=1 Tax=Streptomyces solincola TaxID=2100817 RepID=A0A2S9PVU3_9ACTN|nr:dihydrofolate reductase family protein [Streptomyces solincola]PRH78546.1 deaminase [Streptomyces solincola]